MDGLLALAGRKIDEFRGVPEFEIKVKEATNPGEAWGPTGTQMQEIAEGTFRLEHREIIVRSICSRFAVPDPRMWRQSYKALLLTEHIVKNGSDQVIGSLQDISHLIKRLTQFTYVESGRDHGLSVRERAQKVYSLVNDPEQIIEERQKSENNRTKYHGVGSEGNATSSRYGSAGGNDNGDRRPARDEWQFDSPQQRQTSAPAWQQPTTQHRPPPASPPQYTSPVTPVVAPVAAQQRPVQQPVQPQPQIVQQPPPQPVAQPQKPQTSIDDLFGPSTTAAPQQQDVFGAFQSSPAAPQQHAQWNQQQQQQQPNQSNQQWGQQQQIQQPQAQSSGGDVFANFNLGFVPAAQQQPTSPQQTQTPPPPQQQQHTPQPQPKKDGLEDLLNAQLSTFGGAKPAAQSAPKGASLKELQGQKQQQQQHQMQQQQQWGYGQQQPQSQGFGF